ncbi:LPXTG cell wall anchor domain-containing protein [Streptococcus suis]|nr:LPXTG cell wall anchor domain-containing protein [Streptococcus suis]
MKKNLIKSLTLSTATLAAFSLANTVLADETTTTNTPEQASQVNTTSSQELEKQVAQAETTATTAKSNLEQSQQALAQEENALAEAQKQATSAQADADTAADNLAKASETAKQATDENIASAQKDIDTANTTVAQATSQVDAAEKAQKQAQDAYTQQADQVANAQSNLDAKTATYQATQETINNTQEQEAQAKAQLQKDLSTSQTEVTTLENKISTNSIQLDSAKTELNALKNSANIDELNNESTEKYGIYSETERLNNKTKKRVDQIINPQSTTLILTQTPTVLEEQFKHPEMSATIYSGERTETIYLTAEQAKEYAEKGTITYVPNSRKITEYFVDYLNELKRLNGLTNTVDASNSDLIAYAIARAEENAARRMLTHHTNLNPADFNLEQQLDINIENGVVTTNDKNNILGGENAVSWSGIIPNLDPTLYLSFTDEPLSDQSIAYYLLLGWFTDYQNVARTATSNQKINYGHRINQLMAAGPIGIGFSANGRHATLETTLHDLENDPRFADTSKFDPDFITNEKGETVMVRSGTNTPVVFLPAVTFNFVYDRTKLDHDTAQTVDTLAKSVLEQSKKNLDESKIASDQARAAYIFALKNQANLSEKTAEKEAEISSLETNLKTAQTDLSTAKAKVAQTNEKLTQLEQNSQLDSLNEQLASQEKAVQEAQTNLDTQKAELSQRQTALTQATSLTETAKQDLANAKVQLETAKSYYQALITAQENLASAHKADQEAKGRLVQTKTELEAAKSKLTQRQKEVDEAKLAYDTAKANYDKLLADYKVAKDLEDKAKDNTISTLPDGTIIAVPKDSPSIAERPSLDIEKLLESLKSSETNITGKTNPHIDNNLGLNGNKESQQFKNNQANHVVKPNPSQTANTQPVSLNHRAKVATQTKELPNTGETGSIAYALAGLTLLSTAVLIQKRKN